MGADYYEVNIYVQVYTAVNATIELTQLCSFFPDRS
jgi:hypothetical protein